MKPCFCLCSGVASMKHAVAHAMGVNGRMGASMPSHSNGFPTWRRFQSTHVPSIPTWAVEGAPFTAGQAVLPS